MPNQYAQQAILEIVENQLRADDPPETRQTLDRLLAAGYPRQTAIKMIGRVVVDEIWSVLSAGQAYDAARYRDGLARLK